MRDRLGAADGLLSLLVFAATVFYLASFPLHLGVPDEAKQLHEAKRILGGEVMYRDIFDLILPGWMYLMALLFRVFGTTFATARMTAAVIHGATAALVFLASRQLAARRELAGAAALTYLVVCQPAFPIASQHWLATLLSVAVLAILLRPAPTAPRAFGAGIAIGLLIAAHQQRGLAMGVGAAGVLVIEAALARLYRDASTAASLWRQLAALACGALLVVAPLLAELVAGAGLEPLWRALVVYPVVNYQGTFRPSWGFSGGITRSLPRLLAALPFVLALALSRLIALALSRARRQEARNLALLIVLCAASILSISYNRDFIHIAFIAPLFFVAIAEGLEWTLGLLPARAGALVGGIAAVSILAAAVLRLEQNLAVERSRRTIPYASAFGRVDLGPIDARFCEGLDALLRDAPSRALYVHPNGAYLYLLLDARNPTRFSFILPGYHGAEEMREVIESLSASSPRYVVTMQALIVPGDPIVRFIEGNYDPITKPRRTGPLIWRLRADATQGDT